MAMIRQDASYSCPWPRPRFGLPSATRRAGQSARRYARIIGPMSRLSGSYDLGRATGVCAATGVPLEHGAPCVIALAEVDDPGAANAGTPSGQFLRRLEYSLAAWEAGARPEGLFCFWRTTWTGGQQRKMFVDDETLLDLFHRLEADERPQRQAFRFVLTLFLVRKRLLRMVGQRRERATDTGTDGEGGPESGGEATRSGGREFMLVSVRGADPSAPPLEVFNPRLGEEDIEAIAAQLTEIMSGAPA